MDQIKTPKTKTLKKTPKTVKRIKGPERIKTAVKRIKIPTRTEVKEQSEIIRVLTNVHAKDKTFTNTEWEPEEYKEIKRDILSEENLAKFIETQGNFSAKDTLWHYGSMFFNQETNQESYDRARLYYESKCSYPTKEYMESMGIKMGYFEGWMSGFMIGMAYGRDHIDEETMNQWAVNRAKQFKDEPFEDDDIPF